MFRKVVVGVVVAALAFGAYASRASSSATVTKQFSPGYVEVVHPGGGLYINVHNPTSKKMHVIGRIENELNWSAYSDLPLDVAPHSTTVVFWLCGGSSDCNGT